MSKGLNDLHPAPGGGSKRRIIEGRGAGSRRGHKCGKGNKGQKSRSGYSRKFGFEGGQMPLQRRVPKRGFKNIFRRSYSVVNLDFIMRLEDFDGAITPEVLLERRLVRRKNQPVKILARGEINKAFEIHAHAFSEAARKAIENAGGKVVEIPC
jgi:large subunit ribosomal protein L15